MVNAQTWLNQNYPLEKRKEIRVLNVNLEELWNNNLLTKDKCLKGKLDLRDFINLEELNCSNNELTILDLSRNSKLVKVDCSNNYLSNLSFPPSNSSKLTELYLFNNNLSQEGLNLSYLAKFENLEKLWIGNNIKSYVNQNIYNRFTGSLDPLQELNKLEELDISNTNVDSGLEYLPDSLKKIVYLKKKERVPELKSNQLLSSLNDYQKQSSFSYYDIVEWKKVNIPYYAQVLDLRRENEEQKKQINELKLEIESNKSEMNLRVIHGGNLAPKFKYDFYEQFFINYLKNRKNELNQIKRKLSEDSKEWLELLFETQEEIAQNRAKKNLSRSLAYEELQEIVTKQNEIIYLENQLEILQIQEQQYLEKNQNYEDEDNKFVYEPQEEAKGSGHSSELTKELLTQDKYLDSLARLLTGKETCVGICLCQGKLLIASNWESPKYAKICLEILRKFVDTQSSENFEELIKLVLKEVYYSEEDEEGEVKNFKKSVDEYKKKGKIKLNDLQKSAETLFKQIIDLKRGHKNSEANRKWEHLITWHDVGKIVEVIESEKLDGDVTKAIKENNIEFIEGKYIKPEDREKRLHAEMKIIDKICKNEDIANKKNTYYIGLNKLVCDDCYAVINILNNEEYRWKICGRHGSDNGYTDSWETPTIMQGREEEIKRWREANRKNEKNKETTSKIPERLFDLNLLLEKLKKQEQGQFGQTQIEMPHKK